LIKLLHLVLVGGVAVEQYLHLLYSLLLHLQRQVSHVAGYIIRLGMGAEPQILLSTLYINSKHAVEPLSTRLVAAHLGPGVLLGPAIVATVLLTDPELILEEQPLRWL